MILSKLEMKNILYTLSLSLFVLLSNAQNLDFKEANFKDKKEELKKAKDAIKKNVFLINKKI